MKSTLPERAMPNACERLIKELLALALCISFTMSATAQQIPETASSDAGNQELRQRISELESEVKKLEAEQAAEGPASTPSRQAPAQVPKENARRLKLNVFGDVGFRATDQPHSTSNTFSLGSLDLFLSSRLSSSTSLLGEALFISTRANTIEADIERLLFQYHPNDRFEGGVGRYHTSIGYYNMAFHRGEWFETTIDRPFMYQFDDTGGPLPLQEVGVTTTGLLPSGPADLHYIFEVGNGRSHLLDTEPAQNFTDHSNGKSVNIGLYARPDWLSGLQTGFSIYHNNLLFSDDVTHDELISTAYVVFTNLTYEFLNEAMLVRHTNTAAGAPGVFHTSAFYTQVSRRFRSLRPFFRYQYINADIDEPVYGDPTSGAIVGRRNGASAGVRWDFNDHAAAKLQCDRTYVRGLGSADNIATQFAFTF